MTANTQPESTSPSRRALLAGALGGLGAWAASAIGRASPARAGSDGDVVLGGYNITTAVTTIDNSAGTGISGKGTDSGVDGFSASGPGVYGTSYAWSGVFGYTPGGPNTRGVTGVAYGDGTGVVGTSSTAPGSALGKAKTGVFGYAAQDATSVGVRGESPAGFGVYGKTTGTGFAGYFNGKVFMSQFVELAEIATPASPGSNRARLFIKDNGLGKTQLVVKFANGSVKVLATET